MLVVTKLTDTLKMEHEAFINGVFLMFNDKGVPDWDYLHWLTCGDVTKPNYLVK